MVQNEADSGGRACGGKFVTCRWPSASCKLAATIAPPAFEPGPIFPLALARQQRVPQEVPMSRISRWMQTLTLCLGMLLALSALGGAGESKEPGWVADASRADFPDRPAAGRLHGKAFAVESARIAPYWQTSGPPEKQDRVDGAVLTLQRGKDW